MKNPLLISLLLFLIIGLNSNVQSQVKNIPSDTQDQIRKNIIKINVISPFLEYLDFSFERATHKNQSIHLGIGIIGFHQFHKETTTLNIQESTQKTFPRVEKGFFLNGGYRFYFNLIPKKNKTQKALKGCYAEPNVIFGTYTLNQRISIENQSDQLDKVNVKYSGLLLNLGYQGILFKRLSFDLAAGMGLGNDNRLRRDNDWIYFGEFHRGIYKSQGGWSRAYRTAIKLGYTF